MANAGPDKTGVVNVAVSFDGSGSTDSDGTVAVWWWQYGDGGSDTKSVPTTSHTYTAAGTYSVVLWVRDNSGAWSATGDTATAVISTGTTSTTLASATTSTSSSTSSTTSTSSSTSTSTSRASTTSTSATTSSTTTSTTSKKSTTTTSSTSSTSSSTTTSTVANQLPVANAGPDQLTQTLTMLSLSGSLSYDPDGSISLASWSFGDGTTAPGLNVSHSYATAGTYTATLTVIDNKGASDTDTAVITVQNRPPTANAGPDESGTQNTTLTLNGTASSDPDGSITTYAWTFGDGTTGTGPTPGHTYTAPGTYTAWLTVTDNNGAKASDNAVVTVASTAPPTWARGIGAAGSDTGNAIVGDASGNTVVGGVFRASMTVSGTALTNRGGADWFLAKYSSTGSLLWAKSWGGTSEDLLDGLAIDGNGDVIATGRFSGTASFGGTALTANGSVDMVVAKYSGATGAHLWSKNFGGAYDDAASAVAVDGANNVYFTGYFRGTASFGGATLKVPYDTDLDVFVCKLDGGGVHQWSKNFTNSGNDRGYGIAVDATGNVAIVGAFSNTIDFGGGAFTSANGMTDGFVARFSTTGMHTWSRSFGAPDGSEGAYGAAMDGSGNVFIAAYAVKPVDFGGGTLSALGAADAVVAKYAATSGSHMWSRRLGGTGNDYAYGVAVDGSGNVFVAGAYEDVANFGGISLTAAGFSDAFVAKYGPTGTLAWAKSLGGADNDLARGIGISAGYPVTAGYFYASGNFNGTTLTSAGTADAFLVRIAP